MQHSNAGVPYTTDPRPEEVRILQPFGYHWMRLNSQETGTKIVYVGNRMQFLALLAEWNQSPDWKYWAES